MDALVTSSEPTDHDLLDPLCTALGLEERGVGKLELTLDGRKVTVSVGTLTEETMRGDRVVTTRKSGLLADVHVFFERGRGVSNEARANPPSLELRREVGGDVADKDSGLVKELQLGFPGFDRAVFIDHDATEADARRVLSKEATRQAVLRLLDRRLIVKWGLRSVSVRVPITTSKPPGATLWAEVLEDLLIASKAGGLRDAAPVRAGENVLKVSVGLAVVSLVWAGLGNIAYSVNTPLPWLVAFIVAGLVAFFSRPLLERWFAGHSASARWSTTALGLWALIAFASTGALLVTVNSVFDSTGQQERYGTVVKAWVVKESEDKRGTHPQSYHARIRWPDGVTTDMSDSVPFEQGARVTEYRRFGALGFERRWTERQ